MTRTFAVGLSPLVRCLVLIAVLAGGCGVASTPAVADEHGRGGHEDRDRGRDIRRGPAIGLFLGAPAYVDPPPVYYAPEYPGYGAYPYAPAPITGIYATPYGYCRDYRTAAGTETACQQPDGVWRFIN